MHQGINGVILADGRGMHIGGEDKSLMPIGGIKLLSICTGSTAANHRQVQSQSVLIATTRHANHRQVALLPVISNLTPDFSGPLAVVC